MSDEFNLIFTSTTGRSGTKYLTNLININTKNATSEHDPYPRGYGDPIRWYDQYETEKLKNLVTKKMLRLKRGKRYGRSLDFPLVKNFVLEQDRVYRRLRNIIPSVNIREIYVESTHAFLKSFGEEMHYLHPNIGIIHLIRNPLEVAKSFFNRGSIPGPDNQYLLDPDFKRNELKISGHMSDFQKCLWYWFETELRHRSFLEKHLVNKVYDVDIYELNNKFIVQELFDFFDITYDKIKLDVERNKNRKPTILTEQDILETEQFLDFVPDEVFDRIGDRYSIHGFIEHETNQAVKIGREGQH